MAFKNRISGTTGAIALLAAIFGETACAMSPEVPFGITCRVVEGAKLPAESGGADALCAAIEAAVSAQAPRARASVEVRVLSESMLVAKVTTSDGTALPEQKFASSDRALTQNSFERFGNAIAAALAKANGA